MICLSGESLPVWRISLPHLQKKVTVSSKPMYNFAYIGKGKKMKRKPWFFFPNYTLSETAKQKYRKCIKAAIYYQDIKKIMIFCVSTKSHNQFYELYIKLSIKTCDSVHIVSLAPKFAIPICKLHVPPFLKYHQAAFPFQISHESCYAHFGRDTYQHVKATQNWIL